MYYLVLVFILFNTFAYQLLHDCSVGETKAVVPLVSSRYQQRSVSTCLQLRLPRYRSFLKFTHSLGPIL